MTISYNWLCKYLPEKIDPAKLSKILTAIGLEVESLDKYESIKGGLKGLIVGEILECEQHPGADKLKLTKVNIGNDEVLQIICGAPNAAKGQKVIIAPVGTTIFPISGEPVTMKAAKIRGIESFGMICAEDEIGIGKNHEGIIILRDDAAVGAPVSSYFEIYEDWIYEIGLTPNRMDAMSHFGVARDVCAYLTHHTKKSVKPKSPFTNTFRADNHTIAIKVNIENTDACRRYSGVSIADIKIAPSPQWLQDLLKSIGQRPINNIVDITNYILHETGQPLHAFDADEIKGQEIMVKNLPQGTPFITLDEKERKLNAEDLMICDAEKGVCIAGVFGGIKSGVTAGTKNIFLESAWFNPVNIRKTSFLHELRTEAAVRFEKGVDISNTVNVLKHAALMIKEIAGGEIAGDVVDVYPHPKEKLQLGLKNHYLKKLSGKNYHPDTVKKILTALGFEIIKEGMDELWLTVPCSKPDILLPADIVEEIVRIDGLDNIDIPASITMSPAAEEYGLKENLREKISGWLVGQGFQEILTNSITNSKYFDEETLNSTVKMSNNLSADLDVLRPSMLVTGLEAIAYNSNRQNQNLKFFEFGKIYSASGVGSYREKDRCCLYITGRDFEDGWREKGVAADLFKAKGLVSSIFILCGLQNIQFEEPSVTNEGTQYLIKHNNRILGTLLNTGRLCLQMFDIKQPVYFIDIDFAMLHDIIAKQKISYAEIAKFPVVERDIAFVVDKSAVYRDVVKTIEKINLSKLADMRLFDVFESEKIGAGKKSMAVNFTFLDEQKTLIDQEVDEMMRTIASALEKDLMAQVRK